MAQQAPKKEKTDQELHPENYFLNPKDCIRDRILIHESPDIPREGIFMSLNGYPFLARAGNEIDIPRPVRHMLDTRIKTDVRYDEDGKSYARDMPRITYTLIKEGVNIPEAPMEE